jgi:CxxC motif-containing protein (DUF1111 family)
VNRTRFISGALLSVVQVTLAACAADEDPLLILQRAGGNATTLNRSAGTFETPALNLTTTERSRHLRGDATFGAIFQPPPATVNAGLGPFFNHNSCAGCHVRNGRGTPVANATDSGSSLLVRVSLPGQNETTGGPLASPTLGDQLQDHSIFGVTPEAKIIIQWRTVSGKYADGEAYELREPKFAITLGSGEPLSEDVLRSPRIPPPVFGLGLLEAISEADILSYADPKDEDGDGISGRPNYAWDVTARARRLGRFGWKANTPNLRQQSAAAYVSDMGVTNPLFPNVTGSSDIDDATLTATTFYTQTLAVPARATLSDNAKRGAQLFVDASCTSCHRPTFTTGPYEVAALSNQLIAPYTDLLVHDLGEELADHRPDFDASGTEWRTAPLWGIGLSAKVLGEGAFLHDGRARTLEEAILWHGGEAEDARDRFKGMSKSERAALIAFLQAL